MLQGVLNFTLTCHTRFMNIAEIIARPIRDFQFRSVVSLNYSELVQTVVYAKENPIVGLVGRMHDAIENTAKQENALRVARAGEATTKRGAKQNHPRTQQSRGVADAA